MKRAVILDTDIGGDIDDTWALGVLLRSPELELRAITTVSGDTLYRARLCSKLLRIAGHPPVPVGMGKRIPSPYRWQADWLDAVPVPEDEACIRSDAVQLLIDTVDSSDEPVTLMCIGPLTNIAEMLKKAPGLAEKIDLLVMGGSVYRQYFGEPGCCPEYNIKADIPAAKAVFQAAWRSFWLTPLDTCGNIFIRGERYQRLLRSSMPLPEAVIANYRIWCTARKEKADPAVASSLIADVAAVIQAAKPEMTENELLPLTVDDEGRTVADRINGKNISVALNWKSVEAFYDLAVERLLAHPLV